MGRKELGGMIVAFFALSTGLHVTPGIQKYPCDKAVFIIMKVSSLSCMHAWGKTKTMHMDAMVCPIRVFYKRMA